MTKICKIDSSFYSVWLKMSDWVHEFSRGKKLSVGFHRTRSLLQPHFRPSEQTQHHFSNQKAMSMFCIVWSGSGWCEFCHLRLLMSLCLPIFCFYLDSFTSNGLIPGMTSHLCCQELHIKRFAHHTSLCSWHLAVSEHSRVPLCRPRFSRMFYISQNYSSVPFIVVIVACLKG